MKFIRILLFPFSVLYGWITQLRNLLYEYGFFKSYSFDFPVIVVGNLSVGGTGKTPQIEYLIRLLKDKYSIATLSRGYKRHTKGFLLANAAVNASIIGDEPYQFFQKFSNILVAVDEDRKNGIEKLMDLHHKPNVILLDDAFQHRKVKAGFYILLTAFDSLYYNDFILPTGNLRESSSAAHRADVIIVTKCPEDISLSKKEEIIKKIDLNIPVFFTKIVYDACVYSSNHTIKISELAFYEKILVAGIANPKYFFDYLEGKKQEIMVYPDHHHFAESDILDIEKKAQNKIIITTEKDYMRLKDFFTPEQLFFLPIKSTFLNDGNEFDKIILNYLQQF